MKRIRPFLMGCCALLLGITAWATTAVRLGNEDLAAQAEVVVIGSCVETRTTWIGRNLVTLATVEVKEALKGDPGARLTVVLPGGMDANRRFPVSVNYPGAPRIDAAEEVFLFLAREEDITIGYTILGFSQGKFSIVQDAQGRTVVARDLTKINVAGPGGVGAGTKSAVPLAEFKAEITRHIAKHGND